MVAFGDWNSLDVETFAAIGTDLIRVDTVINAKSINGPSFAFEVNSVAKSEFRVVR